MGRGVILRVLRVDIGACPGLVEVQLTAGPAEGEGALGRGALRASARVGHGAIEEIGQLVATGAARDLVGQGRVGDVEVHVPPGVLVGGSREGVAAVEVEVLDCPLEVVEGLV